MQMVMKFFMVRRFACSIAFDVIMIITHSVRCCVPSVPFGVELPNSMKSGVERLITKGRAVTFEMMMHQMNANVDKKTGLDGYDQSEIPLNQGTFDHIMRSNSVKYERAGQKKLSPITAVGRIFVNLWNVSIKVYVWRNSSGSRNSWLRYRGILSACLPTV